jgi:ferritin-like metal-binding protein YciE
MEQLHELLVDGLRDIYDAEKQLVRALPRLTKALTSNELKQSFNNHLEQTKNQVTRVEQCLELLGEKVKSKPCKAMKGLVEEAQEHLQEHEKGELLDQIITASAQKVEHYEIASYGTAKAIAKSLGAKEALNLIQETLKEEEGQDKQLSGIAIRLQKEMGRAKPAEEAASNQRGARSAGRGNSTGRATSNGSNRGGAKKKVAASRGSHVLTDREEIRQWAEERGAHPACVRGTGNKGDIGILRLDFPGYTGEDKLEEIGWDEFFDKFEERGLSLLVQDTTARGQKSNFNKLVSRETAQAAGGGGRSRSAGRR